MKQIITLIGLLYLMLQSIGAQNSDKKPTCLLRAKSKMSEIGQHVSLHPNQQRKLQNAYVFYCRSSDSIAADLKQNESTKDVWQSNVNKRWQTDLMNTLDDKQRYQYLVSVTQAQVDSLVTSGINILQQSGFYSIVELRSMKKSLVDFNTREQVIIERDRYNVTARNENLFWLRTQRPKACKLCEHIKKLQQAGVLKDGKVIWEVNK